MSQFLNVALQAVDLAKEIILKNNSQFQSLSIKPDNSVVTEIDKRIEQAAKELIKAIFPDHGFLGEELGRENMNSEYTWIIDPIDGTREFTRGLPFFSTLIALMKGDGFILGVSSAPQLNELLYAERGEGAWLNGELVHVSDRAELKKSFILGPAYKYLARTHTFDSMAKLSAAVQGTRNVGGFPGYHWVATGKAEAMLEVDTHIYDVAPFVTIIREAGGAVSDLEGNPIALDSKSFLFSNGKLHQEILSYFHL
jgi:histidinol-phosphatase